MVLGGMRSGGLKSLMVVREGVLVAVRGQLRLWIAIACLLGCEWAGRLRGWSMTGGVAKMMEESLVGISVARLQLCGAISLASSSKSRLTFTNRITISRQTFRLLQDEQTTMYGLQSLKFQPFYHGYGCPDRARARWLPRQKKARRYGLEMPSLVRCFVAFLSIPKLT